MSIRIGNRHKIYTAEVLQDNPVAYWRLGESTGTVARDERGLYNGTYVGSPTLGVAGSVVDNTAAQFASGKYVDLPASSGIKPTFPLTFELWVYPTSLAADSVVLQNDQFSTTQNYYGVQVNVASSGAVFTQYGNGSSPGAASRKSYGTTSGLVAQNVWSHIVCVFESFSTVKFFVNGIERPQQTPSGTATSMVYSSNFSGRIAVATNGEKPFTGSIDDVAIYNYALPESRILAHYNSAKNYTYQSAIDRFVGVTRATDTSGLTNLCKYLWDEGLWFDCRLFPFKAAQNAGTGSIVYGLGGWTSNNINLFGGPTWASDGVLFDATDDRGTWDASGFRNLSDFIYFDKQIPASASQTDQRRFGHLYFGNGAVSKFWYSGSVSSLISNETFSIGINNAPSESRIGFSPSWSANEPTLIVSRSSQSSTSLWKSKINIPVVPPTYGTQDFRITQTGYTADDIVNINAGFIGTGYDSFTNTKRVALLMCKTSLTTTQRETITDLINAL